MGGTRGRGCFLIILGNEMWDKKIQIERAMWPLILLASAGWEDKTTNQKAALSLGYILWRDGAQGGEDRGGRRHIFLAIRFWGKKINTAKFVLLEVWLPINNHTQQPTKLTRHDGGKLGEDAQPSGNVVGALFDHYGGAFRFELGGLIGGM